MNIKPFMPDEQEKPLDTLAHDGGMTAILRSIACIGDSLSSGEFEGRDALGNTTYHDMFEHSWGQYLARMAGITARNFSRGGMTAEEYCRSFGEANGFWNPELACNAYIIALGVNDLCHRNATFGDVAALHPDNLRQHDGSFIGYYAEIVGRIREFRPDAKFFFVTMPRDNFPSYIGEKLRELLYELADIIPNAYVIDLWQYGPEYDASFRKQFYLGGHMNPAGYLLTARMIGSYIDYIIRHHMEDFKELGFIGTPHGRKHHN